jgi:Flp pilus assembly protein TadD
LAAIVAAIAVGIYRLVRRRMPFVIAVLAGGLGLLTWERNQDYRSELAIWTDTAAKRPDNFRAHNNLGALYAQQGDFEEAIRHLSLVLKFQPNDAEAHANLGTIYFTHGQLPEAVEHFEAALKSNPRLLPARMALGVALARLGRRAEAIHTFEELLRLDPDNETARSFLSALASQKAPTATPENPK